METIEKYREILLTIFPVRKTAAQKADFREWLRKELKHAGYRPKEETYGRFNGSVNVVAGDPDRATVFLTAHYDTASRMLVPNFISPTNVAAHVLYHFLFAIVLMAAAVVLSFVITFPINQPGLTLPLFLVLALLILYLSAFGPANPSNANANTSGVLTLLAIAKAIPKDKRVCFVFFDNNERNLLGAKAFKREHSRAAESCLFLNFDCVGDGEHMLLMPSKYSRWDENLIAALTDAFPETEAVKGRILDKGLVYYPSDHRKFKFHVGVAACHRLSGLGYYIPHLRTKKDTVLSAENVAYLTEGISRFLPAYWEEQDKGGQGS